MRFAEWLQIRESEQIVQQPSLEAPQLQLPDAKQVMYTAAVLHKNSQDQLVALVRKLMMEDAGTDVPKGWIGRAHHMTIKFKPKQADLSTLQPWWGKEVNLLVTDWAHDDFGVAVVVESSLPVANSVPHVTVGHSRDVGAVYSNTLLANKSVWKPVEAAPTLLALVCAVGSGDNIFPDLSPVPLAVPAFNF
jgi:hypothetical protein